MNKFLFIHKKSSQVAMQGLPNNLRNETQQFKAIIETIEDGVILIDNNRCIVLMNPAAGRMCGWKLEDTTGISVKSVIKFVLTKGEPLPPEKDPIEEVFATKKSVSNNTLFLLNRENLQISITLNLSPLTDQADEVSAVVMVLRDVTKERAEEQQRADFISTASHEMRTPVAAIEGYLSLALNDKVANIDSRARGYLEKAYSSTQHLGKLFQDLLTSAKAEDGRLTSNPVVLEMGDFIDKLCNDLKLVANKKGLEIVVRSSGSEINATKDSEEGERIVRPLYYVLADPDRLREVITNLFDNAVKYTDEGTITIGITGNDQVVQCYVRDTGPGIPAEDLPHLFQKFYRVDNSATRTIGGTGLGLFICYKIIELYHGQMWAESELNKGSTFYFNLPRIDSQKAGKTQTSAIAKPEI